MLSRVLWVLCWAGHSPIMFLGDGVSTVCLLTSLQKSYALTYLLHAVNLPFGALAILSVVLFLENPKTYPNPLYDGMTTLQKWLALDYGGLVLVLGLTTTLLLALQWGGNTKPWSDGSVIACFVVFGVLCVVFVWWEYRLGERAMLPTKLLRRWTQVGTALEGVCGFYLFRFK